MNIANTISFSPVIAGTMKWGRWGVAYDRSGYEKMIEGCLDLGVTSFDHADIYGDYTTEEEFGAVLQSKPHLRTQMQLISKCGIKMIGPYRPQHQIKSYDSSFEHIIASAERSLKNLHTDYLDLLLIHRPDPLMHPDEIARAFEFLHQQGKVRQFGVSNFNTSQLALIGSRIPISCNQIEASVFHLAPFLDGTLDHHIQHNILMMAWSPLGGGVLGNDARNEKADRIKKAAAGLSEKYQCLPDQLLLAWLMMHPAKPIPVLGTSKLERVKGAMEAKGLSLDREDWFRLWTASTGQDVP